MNAGLHDAYAADYDSQMQAYDCHIADVLFGLCYEFTRPGQCLLDAGIGSGLSSTLFAQAGLEVHGQKCFVGEDLFLLWVARRE